MSAPVCHISPDQTITDQRRKQQNNFQVTLPSVPIATDLASALAAINKLRFIINQLTGALNAIQGGSSSKSDKPGPQGPAGKPGKPPDPPRWSEIDRTTETVRVYNPKDKEQYVDIKRINRFVMRDSVTGVTWEWKR